MKQIVLCLVGLVFLLSACAAPVPSPTPTLPPPTPVPPTRTPLPTNTPLPTETLVPTLTTQPQLVDFAVIGDYGANGDAEEDVSELVHRWKPDFIITVGDNNYPDGTAETIDANVGKYYHDYIYPYLGNYLPGSKTNRFFPVLGNHDWHTAGAQPYLDYFTLPGNERYYDFVWGPVHFFALDSDENEPDGVSADSLQAAWLKQALAASTSPWNIIYTHHAPYSSGAVHGSSDWMQWPFAAWGADALLAGHEHLYERLLVDGIPYFTNGAGGNGLYDFGDPLPESQFRYNGDYGAMLVIASETEIVFEFYNIAGDEIDEYTLPKP